MSERVTVFGAGYVGLVTGTCLAHSGHDVTVVDVDPSRVARLRSGDPVIFEPGLPELVAEGLESGRLKFALATDTRPAPITFVSVGTPPTSSGSADLSAVRSVVEELARRAEPGTLVVMKSTVPPGTGERLATQLASAGMLYASNPEFLREGTAVRDWYETDRIVVGGRAEAAERLARLYADIDAPLLQCDVTSAEMIKYASNAFLATKISFVNEIATLCDLVGAQIDDVARGIGMDSRIGEAFLCPGIGYGGSCFPKDTRALDFIASLNGYDFHLLRAVIEVNARQRLLPVRALRDRLGPLDGKRVAVLGLTFKPATDDVREAPAWEILALLRAEGAEVVAYNPIPVEAPFPVQLAETLAEAVKGADAAIVATEWPEIVGAEWADLVGSMRPPAIVFDGRNGLKAETIRDAGGIYIGVGRPAPTDSGAPGSFLEESA